MTPSSKVVGDLALALAGAGADPAELEAHPERFDLPASVIGFLAGELGTPAGGFPEPFRSRALEGARLVAAGCRADRGAGGCARGPRPPSGPERAALPRPGGGAARGDRAVTATSRSCRRASSCTGSSGARGGRRSRARRPADPRARGGRRAGRARHPHRARPGQRPAAPLRRPRPVRRRGRAGGGAADPRNPGHVAAPYAGAVTVAVERRRRGRGGPAARDDRGDEDGVGDRRPGRRHRRAPRRPAASPRCSRATSCS